MSADSGASLILGDNIFYGKLDFYRDALAIERGACIFGYQVRDPERYGVVEFDGRGRAISLEEKPKQPKSSFAVPGLYVYDNQVVDLCQTLRPSARNELEITDLNLLYLNQNQLHVKLLSRGMAWLDTGTTTALLEASNYIATIEHRQGLKIACLEEIALRMDFISQSDLENIIDGLPKNHYPAITSARFVMKGRALGRSRWDEFYFGCSRSKWWVSAISLVIASGSVAS